MYEKLRSFVENRIFWKDDMDKLQSRPHFKRAHGMITLQQLQGHLFRVVMSPIVLDAWINMQGGNLMLILRALPLVSGAPVAGIPEEKEVLDLRSWIALLAITQELLAPEERVSVRDILSLPETTKGPAFDVALDLSQLHFEHRALHERPIEAQINAWVKSGLLKVPKTGKKVKVDFYMASKGTPHPDWGCRLPTKDANLPVLHCQGQSKQLKVAHRGAPQDDGLKLIREEAQKMYGKGCNHSFLLLVSDQELPAKPSINNVAVLSAHTEHPLYTPLVRFLELLEEIEVGLRDVSVPVPADMTDKELKSAKAAENIQRRQEAHEAKEAEAEAKQAAQPQTTPKKCGKKGSKKRARGEAAPSESGDAAKPAKKAKSKRPV
ncbi:hypothetical protein COCOBI_18-0250 [Coccomyxa sp. Obi]|nr:hypothetical protein COCOBI_18-0250 [Coccomyxa sp. Obi]